MGTLPTLAGRWRVAIAGLAAAAALTLVLSTPGGQSAFAQFLAQFRSQRFQVITIDSHQTPKAMAQLERLGTISGSLLDRRPEVVSDVVEASRRVGFPVKLPASAALPAGVSETPRILVMPAGEYRFTFQKAKAAEYFKQIGRADINLPDKFDGATLVVSVPAAVLLQYQAQSGRPGLVIGQATELRAGVEGRVTLDELRDFLLRLPGLPPDVVQQLRAINDWRTTLPIPVPADRVAWKQVTLGGAQGVLLSDTSGLGSAALWQRDGRVYGIVGPMTAAEIQRVAQSLR
jgi:hypothetical protein